MSIEFNVVPVWRTCIDPKWFENKSPQVLECGSGDIQGILSYFREGSSPQAKANAFISAVNSLSPEKDTLVWLYGTTTSDGILGAIKYITDIHGDGKFYIPEIDMNYEDGYFYSWATMGLDKEALFGLLCDSNLSIGSTLSIHLLTKADIGKRKSKPPIVETQIINLLEGSSSSIISTGPDFDSISILTFDVQDTMSKLRIFH